MSLQDFWLDEEKIFQHNLKRVLRFIRIEKGTNKIVVLTRDRLPDVLKVACYLLGAFIRARLLEKDNTTCTNSKISKGLGLKPNVVAARLKDLRARGLAEQTGKGEHRISVASLEELLDEVESRLK